ncbi:hypothetical protein MHYP_G00308280 [Metynnis hypsauchen]
MQTEDEDGFPPMHGLLHLELQEETVCTLQEKCQNRNSFFQVTFQSFHLDAIHIPYARGRFGNSWKRKNWVFGVLEIRDTSRRPVLRLVEKRNRETLMPLIKKHVRKHSIVVSDEWRAYSNLTQEGYQHVKVNHSVNYVDPQTAQYQSTMLCRGLGRYGVFGWLPLQTCLSAMPYRLPGPPLSMPTPCCYGRALLALQREKINNIN